MLVLFGEHEKVSLRLSARLEWRLQLPYLLKRLSVRMAKGVCYKSYEG